MAGLWTLTRHGREIESGTLAICLDEAYRRDAIETASERDERLGRLRTDPEGNPVGRINNHPLLKGDEGWAIRLGSPSC
jgi:hypothetical protein